MARTPSIPLIHGPGAGSGEDEVVMEYQAESQRGLFVFGRPKFTHSMLTPLDPRPFTTLQGKPLGLSLQDLEVPDDSWVWVWPQWYVDMSADVDDQGWSYAWRFRSTRWQGSHHMFRSFVRQRVWKRPRVKKKGLGDVVVAQQEPSPDLEGISTTAATTTQGTDESGSELLRILEKQRNDRERVDAVTKFLVDHPEPPDNIVSLKQKVLDTLMYPISQRVLADQLASEASKGSRSCEVFLLAPPVRWWLRTYERGEPDEKPEPFAGEEKADEVH